MLQHIQRCSNFYVHSVYGFVRYFCVIPEDLYKPCTRKIMEQKKLFKKLNFTNSNTSMRVLGSGATGAPNSICLTTDHTNYIFNCGEGTQRIAQEYHQKLAKLEHIFLTNYSWKNIGGLVGVLLTVQEIGLSHITLHGSEKIDEYVKKSESFAYYSKTKFKFAPINESEPYRDNVVTIWSVPIYKMKTNNRNHSSDTNDLNINGKRVIDSTETIEDAEKRLKAEVTVCCYICQIHPKRGRLSVEKCQNLGVEIGPLLSDLKQGLAITNKDGTIIRSEDVCFEKGHEVTVIVVECPNEDYLESFVNHTKFSEYQQATSTKEVTNRKVCLFHFTPQNIFDHPKYQSWIRKFSPNTEHVILNDKNTCMGSKAVFKQQYLMNLLHPEIFPLLSEDSLKNEEQTKSKNMYRAKTLQELGIHPRLKRIQTINIHERPESYIDEKSDNEDFSESLTKLKEEITKKTEELGLADAPEYPRIVMLGTGSSTPNKVRNTSAILIRIDENHNILLDCAEGTQAQIIRLYGNTEAERILKNIKAIYLSHKHADHHLGLIGILKAREKITPDKIYVLLPQDIIDWLNFYNEADPISHLFVPINNRSLMFETYTLSLALKNLYESHMNIKEIRTAMVKHCRDSFGVAITLNNGKKIVYSGDAMPCENLLILGKDCDLLIHEATMEDKLIKLAVIKRHSTVSQAIQVGKDMNAKFTLLTHFSQRYSKIAMLSEVLDNVGLAYDNMDIKLSQLPILPLLYPCLKIMYNDHYSKAERKIYEKFELMENAV